MNGCAHEVVAVDCVGEVIETSLRCTTDSIQ